MGFTRPLTCSDILKHNQPPSLYKRAVFSYKAWETLHFCDHNMSAAYLNQSVSDFESFVQPECTRPSHLLRNDVDKIYIGNF